MHVCNNKSKYENADLTARNIHMLLKIDKLVSTNHQRILQNGYKNIKNKVFTNNILHNYNCFAIIQSCNVY